MLPPPGTIYITDIIYMLNVTKFKLELHLSDIKMTDEGQGGSGI